MPMAARLQVVDDRPFQQRALRQLIERGFDPAEDELDDIIVVIVGLIRELEPILEPDDVAVGGQILFELIIEQPGVANSDAVLLFRELPGEELLGARK